MTASGPSASNPAATSPAQAPPDQNLVANTVGSKLPFPAQFAEMTPLAGDASNRRYFRVELTNATTRSVILMQLADPEGFKQSEEAVTGTVPSIAELPFLNIQRHLASVEVPVPKLHYYDEPAGLLYLEDFGDQTLTEACQEASDARKVQLYRKAVAALARIHTRATSPANPACMAFHRSFDVPLLMWEFDHFLEYGVAARLGRPLRESDLQVVRGEFGKIAEMMACQPRVFTHRDYHSRNLMVEDDRMGVLDFQDALLGPATYDLASLLRDAYIEVEEPLIEALIEYYLDEVALQRPTSTSRISFRRLFDFSSIQRNLKAAGRFVYIDQVKKNPKFLTDVPRTLGYVRRNLEKYSELSALHKHLAPYVPELQ